MSDSTSYTKILNASDEIYLRGVPLSTGIAVPDVETTAQIVFSVSNAGFVETTNWFRYTTIGKMVLFSFQLSWSDKGSANGNISILLPPGLDSITAPYKQSVSSSCSIIWNDAPDTVYFYSSVEGSAIRMYRQDGNTNSVEQQIDAVYLKDAGTMTMSGVLFLQ